MPIRRLDPLTIDRIAAGEVIERPAAAIKELVENALDAGAKSIEVTIEAGGRQAHPGRRRRAWAGRSRPRPCRRAARDLETPDGDLMQIATFGFRGEALPSIASVSRLEIRTRGPGAPHGLRLLVEDGIKSAIEPCACATGARVEARDLFAATPAQAQVPQIRPRRGAGRGGCGQAARDGRAGGPLFVRDRSRLELRLAGRGRGRSGLRRAASPGARRRFRLEFGRARRAARGRCGSPAGWACRPLAGRTPRSSSCSSTGGRCATRRSPARCAAPISISCPPTGMRSRLCSSNAIRREVDVNVHPAKAEVRFRDAAAVRGLIVGAIKQRLNEALHRASTTGGTATILAMRPPQPYRGASYSRPLGLARLARRAAARGAARRRASPNSRPRRRRRRPLAERARPRRSARRGAGAAARELHHRPDAGRDRHRRPARGA